MSRLPCSLCGKRRQRVYYSKRQLGKGDRRLCKDCVALRADPDMVVEPEADHTHTVILLHGLYCRADDFESLPTKLQQTLGEKLSLGTGVKYIFINSPVRTISWPDGEEPGVPAWYNYFTCRCGEEEDDDIDMNHWHEASNRVHRLIAQEVQALGDSKKVIVGGNSQGGTIACNVAFSSEYELGALLILRSCALSYTEVSSDWNQMPVFIFIAELDSTFIKKLTDRRFGQFDDKGFTVTRWVEKDLRHEDDSECELWYAAKWICQVFFGIYADVTAVDRPSGPSAEEEEEDDDDGANDEGCVED